MKTYKITKTEKGKKILYEVFDNSGVKIGQRMSTREYVACLVREDGSNGPYEMGLWFGRIDLIGKGDSRHSFGKPGIHVAYLNN